MVDITDAIEVALSLFVKQILSPRSYYLDRFVRIKEAT